MFCAVCLRAEHYSILTEAEIYSSHSTETGWTILITVGLTMSFLFIVNLPPQNIAIMNYCI